jgi:putative peptidoglycan lipid II flippase
MNTAEAVGIVSVLASLSKIAGFIREMAVAGAFGAGLETDAYRVAQGVPSLFFAVVGTALATVLVPTITNLLQESGKDRAFAFVRKISTIAALAAGSMVILLGFLFAPVVVQVMAPGFSEEAFSLSVSLTRILIPGLLFTTLASIATGLNHSLGEFAIPAVKYLPTNFLTISAAIFLSKSLGVWGLSWATLVGVVCELLVQTPTLYRRGFKFGWDLDFSDPTIRQVGILMMPVVIGTALTQINTLVSRVFASTLPVGSISVLSYSSTLTGFVTGVFISAVATVVLSKFSQLVAKGQEDLLGPTVSGSLSSLNALVIPMTAGLMVLRVPIVRFVYERGAFTSDDTTLTAQALLFASLGLVGTGMHDVAARGFYALKDTRTPMINGLLAMSVNIGLLFFFVRYLKWGIAGMALATACSVTFAGVLLTVVFHRRMGQVGLDLPLLFASIWRTVVASILMALVVMKVYPLISSFVPGEGFLSQATELGLTIASGGCVYVLALTILGSEEAKKGWAMVRNVGAGLIAKVNTLRRDR